MWNWLRRQTANHEVVMYTRQGCHLCEEAWTKLAAAQKRFAFDLRAVDVDADPELAASFGSEVPVVALDGKVRFRGHVNEILLRRLLRARTTESE